MRRTPPPLLRILTAHVHLAQLGMQRASRPEIFQRVARPAPPLIVARVIQIAVRPFHRGGPIRRPPNLEIVIVILAPDIGLILVWVRIVRERVLPDDTLKYQAIIILPKRVCVSKIQYVEEYPEIFR
jgi:hypothetical protein